MLQLFCKNFRRILWKNRADCSHLNLFLPYPKAPSHITHPILASRYCSMPRLVEPLNDFISQLTAIRVDE